jgi:hypothetical protein
MFISRKFLFFIFIVTGMVAVLILMDPLVDPIGAVVAQYVEVLSALFEVRLP